MKRKQVGDYLLLDPVGEGYRSMVRLAVHLPTQEKVAVKMYEKNREDLHEWRAMRAEVRRLSKLRHPHLLQLLEAMESEHGYYLVFELASSTSIDQLHPSRFTSDFVRRTFLQLLDALSFLHSEGLMFGHLKLSSCLMDRSHRVKVKGLHRCTALETGGDYPTSVVSRIKQAVDVWSLGVVLLRLISLQSQAGPDATVQRSLQGTDISVPASVPKDLEDLLRRMLDLNPVTRITIPDLYRHPWCLAGATPMSAPGPSPPTRALAADVVREVAQRCGVSEEEVRASVLGHRADSLAATYVLLRRRLVSGRGLPPASSEASPSAPSAAETTPQPMMSQPSEPPPAPAAASSSSGGDSGDQSAPDFRTCLHRLREKARQQRQQRLLSSNAAPSSLGIASEHSTLLSRITSPDPRSSTSSREPHGPILMPSAFPPPSSRVSVSVASCAMCRASQDGSSPPLDSPAHLQQRQKRAALRLASRNPTELYTTLGRRYGPRFVKDMARGRTEVGALVETLEPRREETALTPPPPPNSRLQTRASQRSSASGPRGVSSSPRDPSKSAFGSQLKSTQPRRELSGMAATRTFQWSHHNAVNVI